METSEGDILITSCVNHRYLDTVTQRFGWQTRRCSEDMVSYRLRRKLTEERAA